MTAQPAPTPHTTATGATDALSPTWQRRLALSGVAFAFFLVIGWLTNPVANSPHYGATDQKWTNWAHNDQSKGHISSFAMLAATFIFLHFIAAIRSALETEESSVRGSMYLARVAFAGGVTGIAAMTMAFVSIANASAEGTTANPVVSRAVTTGTAGPFLVGAVGFAALLMSVGVLTLRSGVFPRWTGIVALIGAVCFLVVLLTVLNNKGNGSTLGYAFFPALLSLLIWSVATSIARYRALAT